MLIRRSLPSAGPEEFEKELVERGISYTRRDVDDDHVEFEITCKDKDGVNAN